MKKKKFTYYLQKIVFTLLGITILASCQFEELAEDCGEDKGVIILNLGLDGMSTRATGDTETTISTVRVFVFAGGVLEVNELFTSNNTNFSDYIQFEVVTGDKEIYVVANENSTLTTVLNSVQSKDALLLIGADVITSVLDFPLVMTGHENATVTVSGITYKTIYLTRVAAKISLQLNKLNENVGDVKITRVSLFKNSKKSTLFPTPPATALSLTADDYMNYTLTLDPIITLSTTSQETGVFYVYENLGNNSENKEDFATQLEIDALYNDIATNYKDISTKYRVYINEEIISPVTVKPGDPNSSTIDPNEHLYNIWRNYHYQLTGTISGIGEYTSISVEVKILPWTVHEYPVVLE
ncbi:MAG: fimbrial protein [Fermentimonas sp.]|nr:fimbrial protein [Fermentimonas sp.]